MKSALLFAQIILGVILVFIILLQAKGTGLGRAWGMSGASSFTRRGLDKLIFRATFVISGVFIIISILQLIS